MDIAKRYLDNPLLIPKDIQPSIQGMEITCLLNPGVFKYEGKIWLLLRVAERPVQVAGEVSFPLYNAHGKIVIMRYKTTDPDLDDTDPRVIKYKGTAYLTTLSHFRLVCSEDGHSFYEPEGYPPLFGEGALETYGIEDCRVVQLGNTYHLTYTQVSAVGVGVGLMTTINWKDFDRHGMIFPPHNKDCAIFEEKIKGKYYALHRPSSPELGGNYIWLASSSDLLHWGDHHCIATTCNRLWDSARVGAGAAPIKTAEGWLEIYHGADENHRYCLGALLLDIDDPSKVIARSNTPVMEPIEDYEKTGFFGNVVFTNGHIVEGDLLHLYYGASDEVICAATLSISEVLASLKNQTNSDQNH